MTTAEQPATTLDFMTEEAVEHAVQALPPHLAELRTWAEQWLETWNSHDLDGVVALVHPEIVYEDPAMFGEHLHGKAEFRAFVEMFFRGFPDAIFHPSPDWPVYGSLTGAGVAVPWRCTGTFTGDMHGGPSPLALAPTGRHVDIQGVDLYAFRDGLLVKWTSVVNSLEMLQQLGMFPGPRNIGRLSRIQRIAAPILRRLPDQTNQTDTPPPPEPTGGSYDVTPPDLSRLA